MDYKLLLDTAVMAGEILLESGAETWRIPCCGCCACPA